MPLYIYLVLPSDHMETSDGEKSRRKIETQFRVVVVLLASSPLYSNSKQQLDFSNLLRD